jgi:hypothetical protein
MSIVDDDQVLRQHRPRTFWEIAHIRQVRGKVHGAVKGMMIKFGGPWRPIEARRIFLDVMEMEDGQWIGDLTREQCRIAIIRLIARGLI